MAKGAPMVGYSATSTAFRLFDKSTRNVNKQRDVLLMKHCLMLIWRTITTVKYLVSQMIIWQYICVMAISVTAIGDNDCQSSLHKSEND